MRSLARWCFTHRRIVLAAWLAALIGLTVIHTSVGSNYKNNFNLPGTQSFEALNLLQRNAPKQSGDREQIVIATKQGRVTDPAVRAQVESMLAEVARLPHVATVASPYAAAGAHQISPSGKIAFANVIFDVENWKLVTARRNSSVHALAGNGHGVEVQVEGQVAEQAARVAPAVRGSASLLPLSCCSSSSARCSPRWRCRC